MTILIPFVYIVFRVTGKYIEMDTFGLVAHRRRAYNVSSSTSIIEGGGNGYLFTTRPVVLGEKLIIQFQDEYEIGSRLSFGLTSCNPNTISSRLLPDDPFSLLDRQEYWAIKKHAVSNGNDRDEFAFSVAPDGKIIIVFKQFWTGKLYLMVILCIINRFSIYVKKWVTI